MPKVRIIQCTSAARKSDQGACVNVIWDSSNPMNKYIIKFIQEEDDGTTNTLIKSGVQNTKYMETNLRHGTLYKVTVSLVGNPDSESDQVTIRTLPAVTCEFIFMSPAKHSGT